MKSFIKEVLDRHKAFWNMENVNRPLLRIVPYSEAPPLELVLADGTLATEGLLLKPEMLLPERIPIIQHTFPTEWGGVARRLKECREKMEFPCMSGEMFNPICPYSKIPWMEAISGCPIRVSVKANTIWAEPLLRSDWTKIEINEEWTNKLREFTTYLSDNFSREYLLSTTLMRGPIDVLSAMLGKRHLVLSIYRKGDRIKELLNVLTDLFINVARIQLDIVPRFHGGYCSPTGLWAPGTALLTTTHESTILSQKLCREFVLPFDENISTNFDHSMTEIHSNYLRVVDLFLESESVKSISVVCDPPPFGPQFSDLLPILSKIQGKKPLEIGGEFTNKELDKIVKILSPKGLSICAHLK